jgi:hypothetical protein
MPEIIVVESRRIPAPTHVLYDIISDYKVGHPSILPPEFFGRLDVLAGGRGAGTRIRFEMKAMGKVSIGEATITEPVPGRELRETLTTGIVTTFLVEQETDDQSRVTIRTIYSKPGLAGWLERLFATRFLRRVYVAELERLARVAAERNA